MPISIHHALLLLVLGGTLLAALWDLRTGSIPNRLAFGMTVIGLGLRVISAIPHGLAPLRQTVVTSLSGALVCGILPLALYLRRSLGGGDVKLLMACGVCLGPMLGFELQLFGYGFGLVYALGHLGQAGRAAWSEQRLLCFAPPLSAAALAVTLSYWGWT